MAIATETIWGVDAEGFCYSWQWKHDYFIKVTSNPNGTTGYGTLLSSTKEEHQVGGILRIHLCAHKPCRANHKAAKYGVYSAPIHLQKVSGPVLASGVVDTTAVAEPSSAAPPPPSEVS